MRDVEDLVLLVGGNPMPNYITAMFLKPRTVHLLYTTGEDSTRPVADRLAEALKADMPELEVKYGDLCSKSKPQAIMADYARARIPDTAHLNVTGGTKAMAVFVHQAWLEQTGGRGGCSYLDGSRDVLFDSNGCEYPIRDVHLTIEGITQMHGIQVFKSGYRSSNAPTDDDALAVLDIALTTGAGIKEIKKIHKAVAATVASKKGSSGVYAYRLEKQDLQFPGRLAGIITRTGVHRQEAEWRELVDDWAGFLVGHWLEHAMDYFLRKSECATQSVNSLSGLRPHNRLFEVDVMATRGHRSLVVSCKANNSSNDAKLRSFEVAVRGPQIGGDLTRTAFVGLLGDEALQELRKDHAAVWGDNRTTTRLFGLSHLREWRSGCYDSLKDWAV